MESARGIASAVLVPPSRARDKNVARAFGMRLKVMRTAAGMTQEALAEASNLHPTYISNCERGYSAPTLETLLRLARGLGVRPGQLVDELNVGSNTLDWPKR